MTELDPMPVPKKYQKQIKDKDKVRALKKYVGGDGHDFGHSAK